MEMLHWTVCKVMRRTVVPGISLVKEVCGKYSVRKSYSTFVKHATVVLRPRKSDQTGGCRKMCTPDVNTIRNIKNAFCKELSKEDVGEFVQIRGIVVEIKQKNFVWIKDKTGSVRLVIDNKRKELVNWIDTLEMYSLVKIIGIVREKPSRPTTQKDSIDKFDVEINYVISSFPSNTKSYEKMDTPEELKPNSGLSETLYHNLTANNNLTYTEETVTNIGNSVHVFGWIKSIDAEKQTFTLTGANGSILVSPHASRKDIFHEIQKLNVKDPVVVEGSITDDSLSWTRRKLIGKNNPLQISAQFLKKLSSENFLDLRAPDVNRYTIRSYNCGELNASYAGQMVRLMGWVVFTRMNRFLVLQDKYGRTQLRIPNMTDEMKEQLNNLPLESVISVEGIVSLRPPENENKYMATGEIEISVMNLSIINKAGTLPFYLKDPIPNRSTQLQYKYLDLRHQTNSQLILKFRSDMLLKMRRFLIERLGFIEVETPTLFRRTPGGAQEFIVPTRKKGEFYALVQSPQQFKQLLMVAGLDRYFQIARCYRDEDGRKDRQPEFTQLDLEMSFCNQEGVIQLMEDIIKFIWPENLAPLIFPFPRMTYEEAITTYGTDKPDTRYESKIIDVTHIFRKVEKPCSLGINIEEYMRHEDFTALCLVVHEGAVAFPKVKQVAEELNLSGNCKIFAIKLSTPAKLDETLNKLFIAPISEDLRKSIDCKEGDVVFLGFGRGQTLFTSFGKSRTVSAKILEERDIKVYSRSKPFSFLWVTEIPLFEQVNDGLQSLHHPFSQPHPDDVTLLKTDPLKVRGLTYDLVLNGVEIGGGSIRIHDAKLQKEIYEDILKLDSSFINHLLNALSHGAPSHGGFALGIDRFVSLLQGTTSIQDVIAFPKYSTGREPLTGAPTDILKEDKELYHIQ